MHAAQYAALLHDIAERGVLTPIDLDEQGHILDATIASAPAASSASWTYRCLYGPGFPSMRSGPMPGRSIRCAGTSHAPSNAP